MKTLLALILALAASASAQSMVIAGQLDVVNDRLTWGSDSAIQIRILQGQVHRDTSTLDTLREWKRQDNTADSCSNPVWFGRTAKPVWKYALREMVFARDPDSSTMAYHFEVRSRRNLFRGDTAWTPWVRKGDGVGTLNDPVQDTVAMPNITGTATWASRYALFFVGDGEQIRACPDVISGLTGGQSTDTLILRPRLIAR